jgi:hypothetical protein
MRVDDEEWWSYRPRFETIDADRERTLSSRSISDMLWRDPPATTKKKGSIMMAIDK